MAKATAGLQRLRAAKASGKSGIQAKKETAALKAQGTESQIKQTAQKNAPTVSRGLPRPSNPQVGGNTSDITPQKDIGGTVGKERVTGRLGTTRGELESRKKLLEGGLSPEQINKLQTPFSGETTNIVDSSSAQTGDQTIDLATGDIVSGSSLARSFNAEPGSPEERLAIAAERQTQAQAQLLDFLSKPQQSLVEQFRNLREASGRAGLIESRQETATEIGRIKQNITNFRAGLREQGGAITKAAAARQEARLTEQFTPELQRLGTQLGLQSDEIGEIDKSINQLLQFGQQDRANELKRLVALAGTSNISDAEKSLLEGQIKAEAQIAKQQIEDTEVNIKNFTSNVDKIRSKVLEAGALSPAFESLVNGILKDLQSGAIDSNTAGNRLVQSVSNNPKIKAAIQRQIKRDERLAGVGGGGGTGTGVTEVSFETKEGPLLPGETPKQFKVTRKNGKIIKIEESKSSLDAFAALLEGLKTQ